MSHILTKGSSSGSPRESWVALNRLHTTRHLFEDEQVLDEEEVPIDRSIRLRCLSQDQLSGDIERFATIRDSFLGNITEYGRLQCCSTVTPNILAGLCAHLDELMQVVEKPYGLLQARVPGHLHI